MAYKNNYNNNERSDSIEYRIVESVGILTTFQTGWNKEVNIVAWNGGAPKFDIRDWNPEHDRMTRGITLFESEARKLGEVLNEYFAKHPEHRVIDKPDVPEAEEVRASA